MLIHDKNGFIAAGNYSNNYYIKYITQVMTLHRVGMHDVDMNDVRVCSMDIKFAGMHGVDVPDMGMDIPGFGVHKARLLIICTTFIFDLSLRKKTVI